MRMVSLPLERFKPWGRRLSESQMARPEEGGVPEGVGMVGYDQTTRLI